MNESVRNCGSQCGKSRILDCFADINLNKPSYTAMLLGVIKNLCCDIIFGLYFQKEHRSVIIKFVGEKPDLVIPNLIPVCALSEASLGGTIPLCKPLSQLQTKRN